MLSGFSGSFLLSATACSKAALRSAMACAFLSGKSVLTGAMLTSIVAGPRLGGTRYDRCRRAHVARGHRMAAHGQRRQPDDDRRRLAAYAGGHARRLARARARQAA